MKTKELHIIIALAMCAGFLPHSVYAEEAVTEQMEEPEIEVIEEEETVIDEEQEENECEPGNEEYWYHTTSGGEYDPSGFLYFCWFEHGAITVTKDTGTYGFPVFIIKAQPDENYETHELSAINEYGQDMVLYKGNDWIAVGQFGFTYCNVKTVFEARSYYETETGDEYDPSGKFYVQAFEHGKLSIRNDCYAYTVPVYIIETYPEEGYATAVLDVTDSKSSWMDAIIERKDNYVALDQRYVNESIIHAVFEKIPHTIAQTYWNKAVQVRCLVNGEEAAAAGLNDEVRLELSPQDGFLYSGVCVKDEDNNTITEGSDEVLEFTMPNKNITVTVKCGLPYIDENGIMYTVENAVDLSEVKSSVLNSGWYYVSKDMAVSERIEIRGDVNLILCDNCRITTQRGIHLTGFNSLNVWGQEMQKGILYSERPHEDYQSSIGGNDGENGGVLRVYGGRVLVEKTGEDAAGIGGGRYGNGGNIFVYGGYVSSECGKTGGGAGIGGGLKGRGGNIHIFGGTVKSSGAWGNLVAGAGIGGGHKATSGSITIEGGEVEAYGGAASVNGAAAGIGGGDHSNGDIITISGGKVRATGGCSSWTGVAAGIGGGYCGSGGYIDIYGGDTIGVSKKQWHLLGDTQGAGIGCGADNDTGDYPEVTRITLTGGRAEGHGYQAFGMGTDGCKTGTVILGDNMAASNGGDLITGGARYDAVRKQDAFVIEAY